MRWFRSTLGLTALLACSSPLGLDERDVAGEWFWARSEGGIAGVQLTPATEGFQARLELDGFGAADAFRNDSLIASTRYTLISGQNDEALIEFDPPLTVLPFASIENGTLRVERDGSLRIEEPCCDRFTHTFSRTR